MTSNLLSASIPSQSRARVTGAFSGIGALFLGCLVHRKRAELIAELGMPKALATSETQLHEVAHIVLRFKNAGLGVTVLIAFDIGDEVNSAALYAEPLRNYLDSARYAMSTYLFTHTPVPRYAAVH